MLYLWLGPYSLIKFKLQKYYGLPDVLNEIQCFSKWNVQKTGGGRVAGLSWPFCSAEC